MSTKLNHCQESFILWTRTSIFKTRKNAKSKKISYILLLLCVLEKYVVLLIQVRIKTI